jgi:hypothetical protein
VALLPTTIAAGNSGHITHSNQAYSKLNGAWVDVKADFGAAGNGSTNDATAINNAVTAAAALGVNGGATVYFPPGDYNVGSAITVSSSNVRLLGAGRNATRITRTADTVCVAFYGPTTGADNHIWYNGIEHMTLRGGDFGGSALLDLVYVNQFNARALYLFGTTGISLDIVESQDSNFSDIFIEYAGGIAVADKPAVYLRSSRAASGFGSSTGADNVNEISFLNLHCERFRAGAVKISAGPSGGQANGIYFTKLKMESPTISNTTPMFWATSNTDRIHVKNVYGYCGGLLDGSAVDVIRNECPNQSSFRDVMAASGAAEISSAVRIDTGNAGQQVVDGINGSFGTGSPTVALVNVVTAGRLQVGNLRIGSGSGTPLTGHELDGQARTLTLTGNITTTSTSITDATGLIFANVMQGTYTLDFYGLYQSSLTTAGPRFGFGGTATVSTVGGAVTMWTSTTASTVAALTAANTTGGANPGTATTSFPVSARATVVVTAAGTLGVRWLESAASTGTLIAGSYASLTRTKDAP